MLNRREVEPSLHPHAPLVIEALKPKRALPHLRELKQVFGLKANKGDADYHEEMAFAGGLRNQYRGALSHDTELRECLGLKANKGDADYHEAVVWLAASGTCIAAHCPTSRSSASASASGKTKGTQTTTGR